MICVFILIGAIILDNDLDFFDRSMIVGFCRYGLCFMAIPLFMSNKKITEDTTTAAPAKDAPALVKKIGRTTYIVRVHFSKTSRETMSDKIKRMLKNETQQM